MSRVCRWPGCEREATMRAVDTFGGPTYVKPACGEHGPEIQDRMGSGRVDLLPGCS